MQTRQTIAIIGASGNLGSAISRSLSKRNYRLLLKADEPEQLDALIAEIKNIHPSADVEMQGCSMEASWEADIIILAIPYEKEPAIAAKIQEVANQKVVIRMARLLYSFNEGMVENSFPDVEARLQNLLPNSKVVNVFNNRGADLPPLPDGNMKVKVLLAGNDDEALETAADLLRQAGFNPIIARDANQGESINTIFSF